MTDMVQIVSLAVMFGLLVRSRRHIRTLSRSVERQKLRARLLKSALTRTVESEADTRGAMDELLAERNQLAHCFPRPSSRLARGWYPQARRATPDNSLADGPGPLI